MSKIWLRRANSGTMKVPYYIKIVSLGVFWTIGFLFVAYVVAVTLCSTSPTYTNPAGDYIVIVETRAAAPEVAWSLMTSPVFAIPAGILLLLGWVLIWLLVPTERRRRDR